MQRLTMLLKEFRLLCEEIRETVHVLLRLAADLGHFVLMILFLLVLIRGHI